MCSQGLPPATNGKMGAFRRRSIALTRAQRGRGEGGGAVKRRHFQFGRRRKGRRGRRGRRAGPAAERSGRPTAAAPAHRAWSHPPARPPRPHRTFRAPAAPRTRPPVEPRVHPMSADPIEDACKRSRRRTKVQVGHGGEGGHRRGSVGTGKIRVRFVRDVERGASTLCVCVWGGDLCHVRLLVVVMRLVVDVVVLPVVVPLRTGRTRQSAARRNCASAAATADHDI